MANSKAEVKEKLQEAKYNNHIVRTAFVYKKQYMMDYEDMLEMLVVALVDHNNTLEIELSKKYNFSPPQTSVIGEP